jgi:hypothetical protein
VSDAPAADAVPVEHHLVQRLVGDRAWRVQLALGLLDDHLQLAPELVGVDHRVAEGVGLDIERGLETGGGEDGEVRGVVVRGAGVEVAARALGLPRDGSHPAARGALEEHVLEDVGDAGPAVGLVEEPRPHVGDDRHHRRGVIGLHQQGQAVVQDLLSDTGGPIGTTGALLYCTILSTPASALPRMNASASVVGMTTPVSAWPRRARLVMKSFRVPWAHSRSAAFI